MNLPLLEKIDVRGKRVVVRADLDVSINGKNEVSDATRLTELIETLNYLFEHGASKVLLIGHRGRPEGEVDTSLTLEPVFNFFKKEYQDVYFLKHRPILEFFEIYDEYSRTVERLVLMENLRFYKEEEKNDTSFAEELLYFGEAYVNDAFASSHREHSSVSALPKIFKNKYPDSVCIGVHFQKEIENLSKILKNPEHPVTFIISGAKEDKLTFLPKFTEIADTVLIGGKLPEFMPEESGNPKIIIARLIPDKEDITIHSIEQFEQIILSSRTIFVSGPVGKFEEPGHLLGTQRVLEAVSKANALKIAGGGDTTTAIHELKLERSFDWISTGGGASLEFIAKGTLPGIEVITGT